MKEPTVIAELRSEYRADRMLYVEGEGNPYCPEEIQYYEVTTVGAVLAAYDTVRTLLAQALPYLEAYDDTGPYGEGWQSPALEQCVAAVRAVCSDLQTTECTDGRK